MEGKSFEEQINIWSMRFLLGVSTVAIIAGLSEHLLEAIIIGTLGIVGTGVLNIGISYIKVQSLGNSDIQDRGLLFLLNTSKLMAIGSGLLALYGLYEYFY